MSATAEHLSDPELLGTEWDLGALLGEASVRDLLDEASDRAARFAAEYLGRVAQLDAGGLRAAMLELEAINELIGRVGSYVSLRFATDTADPERGAQLQLFQERATEVETQLLFFELEWAALPDERAEELLSAPGELGADGSSEAGRRTDRAPDGLDFCAHYLRSLRRYRPHLLSESEEKVLAEKSISSQSSWARLFGELVASIRVGLPDGELPLDVALARLQSLTARHAAGCRGGHRCTGARPAHPRLHLQHPRL